MKNKERKCINKSLKFLYAKYNFVYLFFSHSFGEVNPGTGTFDCLCLTEVGRFFLGLVLSFPLC